MGQEPNSNEENRSHHRNYGDVGYLDHIVVDVVGSDDRQEALSGARESS